jgi:hypothetical protein
MGAVGGYGGVLGWVGARGWWGDGGRARRLGGEVGG